MSVQHGANLGLLVGANDGDSYGDDFRKFLRAIDALVFPFVRSLTVTAPPTYPTEGDRYVVPPGATGAWAGHTNAIASWTLKDPANPAGVWEFFAPNAGFEIATIANAAGPTLVQAKRADTHLADCSVAFDTPNVAGNGLLALVAYYDWNDSGVGSISDLQANAWMLIAETQYRNDSKWANKCKLGLFYAPACRAGANTVTVAKGGFSYLSLIAIEYSGIGAFVAGSSTSTGQATSLASGIVSTVDASDLLFSAAALWANQENMTPSSGFTARWNDGSTVEAWDEIVAAGDHQNTVTIDGAGETMHVLLVALKTTSSATVKFYTYNGGTWELQSGAGGSSIDLQVNGAENGLQTRLNLKSGSNVTLTDDGQGGITIASSGGTGSSIDLRHNGIENGSQVLLNLKAGANLTISDDGAGGITLAASQPTLPTFKTNGTNNGSQSLLNLKNGANVTIADDGSGGITISASGGGAAIDLQHDGAENGSQTKLNLKSGSNVSITDDAAGGLTIAASDPHLPVLQVNGVNTGSQDLLNLKPGTNITIGDDGAGGITISGSGGTAIALQTNGVANGSQSKLNLVSGSNVSLLDDGAGNIGITSQYPIFQVNSSNKTNPGKIDFRAGTGITITDNGASGGLTFAAAAASGPQIVATVANQTLSANTGNTLAYTSPSGGFYRITASISVTKTGTAGTIGLQIAKNTTISIINVGTVNVMTLGNNLFTTCCVRLAATDKIYWNSSWSGTTGAPTVAVDVVVEYLGA